MIHMDDILNDLLSTIDSDKEKLKLLSEIKKQVNVKIKDLTTDGDKPYSKLLRDKITIKLFGVEYDSVFWSPKVYNEYNTLRKKINSEIGEFGKSITKSQYEEALKLLNSL